MVRYTGSTGVIKSIISLLLSSLPLRRRYGTTVSSGILSDNCLKGFLDWRERIEKFFRTKKGGRRGREESLRFLNDIEMLKIECQNSTFLFMYVEGFKKCTSSVTLSTRSSLNSTNSPSHGPRIAQWFVETLSGDPPVTVVIEDLILSHSRYPHTPSWGT